MALVKTKLFKPYDQSDLGLSWSVIDAKIPSLHPVRVVNDVIESLDLSGLISTYKGGGAPSYHPLLMLKVWVYGYLRNIHSSRQLETTICEHIHFMWLAGGHEPDHNSLNRFRNSGLKAVLKEIFTQVVLLLHDAGHLDIRDICTDGTKLEAQANRYSFVWAKSLKRHRARIAQQLEELWAYAESVAKVELGNSKPCDLERLDPEEVSQTIAQINQALKSHPESDKKQRQKGNYAAKHWPDNLRKYAHQEEVLAGRNSYSKTDSDATFMRMKEDHMKNGQLKPAYNCQLSTHHQWIIHYSLHANPGDTLTYIPHLQDYQNSYGQMPQQCTTDAGYGSEENYAFFEQNNIEAFVKYNYFHQEQKASFLKKRPFRSHQLYYNEQLDQYICPMGQPMKKIGTYKRKTASGYEQQITKYQAQNCQGCPLRGLCYKGKAPKRVIEVNHRLNHFKAKARDKLLSEEGIQRRKRRPADVEATFGILKQNHGFRRALLRGKEKVEIEIGLHALAHNLRKLAAKKLNKPTKQPLFPISANWMDQ